MSAIHDAQTAQYDDKSTVLKKSHDFLVIAEGDSGEHTMSDTVDKFVWIVKDWLVLDDGLGDGRS